VPLLRLIAPVLVAASLVGASTTVVHRGQLVRIAIKPTTINNCLAHVQYADDSGVDLPVKYPNGEGRVSWTFLVPTRAPLGVAHWTVRCGVLYETGGNWLIVPAGVTVGPKPPKPVVTKQGFSQRPEAFGTGSTASYGLLIRNPASKDARDVSITVSFGSAAGTTLGRATTTIARIGAGETFALGGSTELSSQAGATKLTATVRVGSYRTPADKSRPRVANARIVPSQADPGWVGEVDGEIVNDASQLTLARAVISVVVLDANGRIVGGGTGALSSPLASGARGPFAARLGFSAIPIDHAARPVVSVVPTYR
jgi:hypothetical protein